MIATRNEEHQEALKEPLSLHYSGNTDEATRNCCVSFTSDNNREVTLHWFPQLKEGTNINYE